jgi:hypothetical protein
MPNWNGPQPAPKAVWQLVNANFPATRFLGIFNSRNIAGTNTPSAHAEGRALDIGLLVSDPNEKAIGDGLFLAFREIGPRIGLDHVIWDRQIWGRHSGGPSRYTGVNPHSDHVHVAFTREGSQSNNLPLLVLRIAQLRTGLEELAKATSNVG